MFLNMLHTQAKGALSCLERYRRIAAYKRCSEFSQHQKAFKDLITAQKNMRPSLHFTNDGHDSGFRLIHVPDL